MIVVKHISIFKLKYRSDLPPVVVPETLFFEMTYSFLEELCPFKG